MDLTYRDALKLLEARGFGIRPDRSRIEALVELLDHPERTYPCIHVAGTNGKSSTARLIGAILAGHGLGAGVYTSPHLQSIRERFLLLGPAGDGVLGEIITREELAATLAYLKPFVELVEDRLGEDVTYFELATAMAFEWMSGKSVAAGVFETGMGGTWDATNVVEAGVAVLTRVAVDHAAFLGPTPLDNAREKVGIVKPGSVVVSAPQRPEVIELVEQTAGERDARLVLMDRDFRVSADRLAVSGRLLGVEGAFGEYQELYLPLHGAHQSVNAALAIVACEQFFGRALDAQALQAGLASVTAPGRLEVVRREPLVVLDGAHNPDAAALLGPAVDEAFGGQPATFVISVFEDKDVEGVVAALLPWAHGVVFTRSSSPRSAAPERLAAAAAARAIPSEFVPSLPEAVDAAIRSAGEEGLVVVTGSLYAVGEARDHLVGPLD